jgi:hypothetical protein
MLSLLKLALDLRCEVSSLIAWNKLVTADLMFRPIVYEIKLGTVDLSDADSEWHLTPFTRTAHKRVQL